MKPSATLKIAAVLVGAALALTPANLFAQGAGGRPGPKGPPGGRPAAGRPAPGSPRDKAEDRRDKREDVRDKKEDVRDRAEDKHDAKHQGGPADKREDVRDKKEDRRDAHENFHDRLEDAKEHHGEWHWREQKMKEAWHHHWKMLEGAEARARKEFANNPAKLNEALAKIGEHRKKLEELRAKHAEWREAHEQKMEENLQDRINHLTEEAARIRAHLEELRAKLKAGEQVPDEAKQRAHAAAARLKEIEHRIAEWKKLAENHQKRSAADDAPGHNHGGGHGTPAPAPAPPGGGLPAGGTSNG